MQQYVCARVTRLNGMDVGLFDFDRHNALYFFILNADEEIYLRYGGRDAESASTYLNLRSLELALKKGLELHADKNWKPIDRRPKQLLPEDIKTLADHVKRRFLCVECHMVADYQTIEWERDGKLDRLRDLHVSPDIKEIGLFLDIPKGLVIKNVTGAALDAKLQPGDCITELNGKPVYTYADFQYRYGKINRNDEEIEVGIKRGNEAFKISLRLPKYWWLTDTAYRRWTVEPQFGFQTRSAAAGKSVTRKPTEYSIVSKVISVDKLDDTANPPLQVGDLILSVNDNATDKIADNAELHIKLRYSAGDKIKLLVERQGKKFESIVTTVRQHFRKSPVPRTKWVQTGTSLKGEVSFEVKLVGDYLIVEASHATGWHTYSMDNAVRAREAAGDQKILGVEQGLEIAISGGVKPVTPWRQSKPKEFTDLDQKWFSFGFDGKAIFARKVEPNGAKDVFVEIRGQVCNSQTCRPVNVGLRIPNVKDSKSKLDLDQLVEVKQQSR